MSPSQLAKVKFKKATFSHDFVIICTYYFSIDIRVYDLKIETVHHVPHRHLGATRGFQRAPSETRLRRQVVMGLGEIGLGEMCAQNGETR